MGLVVQIPSRANTGHLDREKIMRFGRFEKWILVNCFTKTIQGEVPEGWRRPRGHRRREAPDGFHDKYLFKSEVLLNYFPGLKLSEKQSAFDDVIEKFQTTKEYGRALATYRRAANQLEAKGMIQEFQGVDSPRWTGIVLTDAGIQKAIELAISCRLKKTPGVEGNEATT